LTVGTDVKDTVLAADELGIHPEALLQGRGQTGRARVVVSRHAPCN
jgi:hypothetical protein